MQSVISKQKNIDVINKILDENGLSERERKRVEYQIVFDLLTGKELPVLKKELQNGKVLWEHPAFEEPAKKLEEVQFFISNPVDAVSGVFTCGKCGGDKTVSFSKQVRSADEGTSVFVKCVGCSNTWTHSG